MSPQQMKRAMMAVQVKLVTKHLQPLHDELQKALSQASWQRRGDASARYPSINQVSHLLVTLSRWHYHSS